MQRPATPMRRLAISSSAIATEVSDHRAGLCFRVAELQGCRAVRQRVLAQDLRSVIMQGRDATAIHGTVRAGNLKAEEKRDVRCQFTAHQRDRGREHR